MGIVIRAYARGDENEGYLYQGRKVTDRIAVNLLIAKSEYDLALLEADGKLIVEREVVGCYDDVKHH